jgi:hypothetical protein
MGTSGVPWSKDRNTIIEAIKRHKGRITLIAKDPLINCHFQTIQKRINADEELKELLCHYRNDWVESTLNQAEDVLKQAMDMVIEEPGVALKSAMFFLNNQGKERGYASPEEKASQSHYTIKLESNGLGTGLNISAKEIPTTDH